MLGFSWPIVLYFAGQVTTFQVFLGTGVSGILYFAIKAWFGYTEVGTFSLLPTTLIAICGLMSAYGCEKYIPLLAHPKYVGISLALTQVIVVFGLAFVIWNQTGKNTIIPANVIGLVVTAIGLYLMNLK